MPRLHHVNVTCHPDDTETVAAFYREVLRLAPVEKAAGTDPAGAWFTIDATSQVHLSEREAAAHPDAHFALVVDDFAGVVERLRARRPRVADGPADLRGRAWVHA